MIEKYKGLPDSDHADEYDTQYYGKDAEQFLKKIGWEDDIKFLGKECVTEYGKEGIILGIEDSNSFMDYYYIVYVPSEGTIKFELANSQKFVDSIKL